MWSTVENGTGSTKIAVVFGSLLWGKDGKSGKIFTKLRGIMT
jgi:hypothetical protein